MPSQPPPPAQTAALPACPNPHTSRQPLPSSSSGHRRCCCLLWASQLGHQSNKYSSLFPGPGILLSTWDRTLLSLLCPALIQLLNASQSHQSAGGCVSLAGLGFMQFPPPAFPLSKPELCHRVLACLQSQPSSRKSPLESLPWLFAFVDLPSTSYLPGVSVEAMNAPAFFLSQPCSTRPSIQLFSCLCLSATVP